MVSLDYNKMDQYDITTLISLIADDAVELYLMTKKREEIEQKHRKTYAGRPDWKMYSTRFVELEYDYAEISKEIIRRAKKND